VSNIKASSDVWKLCIERFSTTAYAEVKFWCLQTLQGVRLLLLRGWHTIETQLQDSCWEQPHVPLDPLSVHAPS
jgi:hypothetical protein